MRKILILCLAFIATLSLTGFQSNKPAKVEPLQLPSLFDVKDEIPNEEKSILDWQRALYGSADPDAYEGADVEVFGFVYRLENDPAEVFFVGRKVIWCCYDDAVPQGLGVYLEENEEYEDGDWLIVKGKWARMDFGERVRYMIIPESIERADAPETEYLLAKDQ